MLVSSIVLESRPLAEKDQRIWTASLPPVLKVEDDSKA